MAAPITPDWGSKTDRKQLRAMLNIRSTNVNADGTYSRWLIHLCHALLTEDCRLPVQS